VSSAGENLGVVEEEPPDLVSLVSPFGVVGRVTGGISVRGFPRLKFVGANVGVPDAHRWSRARRDVTTHGLALDDVRTARIVAIAEGAERYAGMTNAGICGAVEGDWIWSSASDMCEPTIDLGRLPRCSDAEYAHPDCPLTPFDPNAVIRWTRGVDLASGDHVWVPSMMVIYGLVDRTPAESFVHGISTGHAVHTDPHIALCSAICEVIERDIIEILWSQRLPLPPVAERYLSADGRQILDWCADHFIEAFTFDATSDLGVPTVYCLMRAEHDDVERVNVSCATGVTLTDAADKALRDALAKRGLGVGLRDTPVKTDFKEFTDVMDGARYMGLPEHASAFDFLLDGYADRRTREHAPLPDDPRDRLRHLIDTLVANGMQVIAVDRTTPELVRAGLTAVCVIVPDLLPMSLNPLARYRAHPRLYSAPVLMGYSAHPEEELNPWPQPFA
jgi:ribosomal protein S12 methylthiotransferase accessory factor